MPRALILLVLLLAGCSSSQLATPEPAGFVLLPPSEIAEPVLLKQAITFLSGQGQQQFLAVARFEAADLELVVLLPGGQRLLTLEYDGVELMQKSSTPVDLPGREILAVMQFSHWPESSLQAHYPASDGWQLSISPGERQLLTASGPALNISYQAAQMQIDNFLTEYRVIVQTLESSAP